METTIAPSPALPELLYLVHRLPFPPNKGDKIRSFHILQYLRRHFRVHLGCFVDDPADHVYLARLAQGCASTCFIDLPPRLARLRSLTGLFTGEALSLPYYRHRAMHRWVRDVLATGKVHHALVFSGPMAQYLPAPGDAAARGLLRIIDFVDVDSEKWRAYAPAKPWPLAPLYRREARRLLAHDRQAAVHSAHVSFVSRAEAALFLRRAPEASAQAGYFHNGVDSAYFSPQLPTASPYPDGGPVIVFTGAMDYWPNIEAVLWFAAHILPAVHSAIPEARFAIVGARPAKVLSRLRAQAGVMLVGGVPDMRPYLAHAALAVAPLHTARGVQNKVLEAMAMQKIVIATPQALEGISAVPGQELLVASAAPALIACVIAVLHGDVPQGMAQAARRRILLDYRWEDNLGRLGRMLGMPASVKQAAEVAP